MNKKIQRNRRHTLLWSLLLLLVVLAGVYALGVYQIYHFNDKMVVPKHEGINLVARFKLHPRNIIRTAAGFEGSFDMGSRHSFISTREINELRKIGYPVRVIPTLIYSTDRDGHYQLFTQKVVMPIRLHNPEMPDSVIVIENVELLITPRTDNVLGMDFLEHFVMEYDHKNNNINLYHEVPKGYVPIAAINSHDSKLGDMIGYSRRVYVPMLVDGDDAQNYYFDTGLNMRDFQVVQPEAKLALTKPSEIIEDPETGIPLKERTQVILGNRLNYKTVAYVDTLHTDEYAINPFAFFTQDFVIDFPGQYLLFHKTSE